MKRYFLGLALVAFVSAAFAIRGLHARTTTPPVYVVVEIDGLTDANGFEALRQTAAATAVEVQYEDGRYFASTENVTAIDGSAPKLFAFIAFDNMTKAKTFLESMKSNRAAHESNEVEIIHRRGHIALALTNGPGPLLLDEG